MPKGRVHVPPTASDGIWFQHRGFSDPGPMKRELVTCTGRMLSEPFDPTTDHPPKPSSHYQTKDAKNFKLSNKFSEHDNRHSFQDHGVYFGNDRSSRHLGKNIIPVVQRQHYTDKHYLKHNGREIVHHDYLSVKESDYKGLPTADPPRHRRFARNHKEGQTGLAKLTTDTTLWTDAKTATEPAYRTPLHVLAVTQEPFLPANSWKYSNHGLSKIYPSYNHVKPIGRGEASYTTWHLDAPHVAPANAKLKSMSAIN